MSPTTGEEEFCPRCEARLEGAPDYCPYCAAPVSAREIEAQSEDGRSCAYFVCLCFGILFVYFGGSLVYLATRSDALALAGPDLKPLFWPGWILTAMGVAFFIALGFVIRAGRLHQRELEEQGELPPDPK